ncbi:MAG TPA: iron ABC transporter permease [Gammaproteobacteria bacterium]|nr:iron ABC transporter permease [Gammaproteobacteria bacterium]
MLSQIRIPRVALAFLAGASLALCGMAFQSMFRNPLATPFTLGVSSGASLGALIALRLGLTTALLGISTVTIGAFLGALIAISLVYGLTRMRGGFSTSTMLLAGVAVSFFFSSLILFIQYTADIYDSFRLMRWLMGGIATAPGYTAVTNALPFAIPGALVVFYCAHELNLLATGDEIAISRGVNVKKTKVLLFFATSVTVGGVVAQCGPIGFIGMMAPHICRLLIGPDHRYLAPATCLFGGAFLATCDTFARTVLAPAELPVGVVTAFLGGPFFLWLLMRGEADRNLH